MKLDLAAVGPFFAGFVIWGASGADITGPEFGIGLALIFVSIIIATIANHRRTQP